MRYNFHEILLEILGDAGLREEWKLCELDVGKAIKILREKKNMSQWDVAMNSGLKPDYISRLERRIIKNPQTNTVFKLAKAFGLKPSEFIEVAENEKKRP